MVRGGAAINGRHIGPNFGDTGATAPGEGSSIRVGLNLLHLQPGIGGVYQYVERFVAAVAEFGGGHTYVAFVNSHSACMVPEGSGIEVVPVPLDHENRYARIAFENFKLPALARAHNIDVMHWFANTKGLSASPPAVVTIYDLQVYDNPADYSRTQRPYYRYMLKHAVEKAPCIATISQASVDAIARRFPGYERKVVLIYPVIGQAFFDVTEVQVADLRSRLKLPETYWLYVANFYDHKNHTALLEAYAAAKAEGDVWPLLLRGTHRDKEPLIRQKVVDLGLEKDVRFLEPIDEADMPALNAAAGGMVFPSLFEGAGIPALEAMAAGCPMIHSDIPTGREFAGDAAILFDPKSVDAIKAAIVRLQSDPMLRKTLVAKGKKRAEMFSAEAVAIAAMAAYEMAAGKGK